MSDLGNLFENSSDSTGIVEDTNFSLPPDKNVVFYNDDFTTMEFVTEVLVSVFDKTLDQAEALMLKVHEDGSAVIGTYTYDIAVSRMNLTKTLARKNGFPLRVEVE